MRLSYYFDFMAMAVPNHLAIIMDGNGRWARAKRLPRAEGHRQGMTVLRKIVQSARRAGVRHLSVFAFSSENWSRPKQEVDMLLKLFVLGLQREAKPLREADVQLHIVGDTNVFSPSLRQAILMAQQETSTCQSMTLNVCMNYGGRWDIAEAARQLQAEGLTITEQNLEKKLALPWAGPVDLMIRTGGEQRISNFLLWQAAYSELWFSDVLWPDFGEDDLQEALSWFSGRERRFGKTSEQVRAHKEVNSNNKQENVC